MKNIILWTLLSLKVNNIRGQSGATGGSSSQAPQQTTEALTEAPASSTTGVTGISGATSASDFASTASVALGFTDSVAGSGSGGSGGAVSGGGGINVPELPLLPFPPDSGGSGSTAPFVLPDFSPCPQTPGTTYTWVVVFVPGDNGDYPSVCLPQQTQPSLPPINPITPPPTTSTTTTMSTTTSDDHHHHHSYLHFEYFTFPGLVTYPLFYDPFPLSPFIYEPALGWFRSSDDILNNLKNGNMTGKANLRSSKHLRQKHIKLSKNKILKNSNGSIKKIKPLVKKRKSKSSKLKVRPVSSSKTKKALAKNVRKAGKKLQQKPTKQSLTKNKSSNMIPRKTGNYQKKRMVEHGQKKKHPLKKKIIQLGSSLKTSKKFNRTPLKAKEIKTPKRKMRKTPKKSGKSPVSRIKRSPMTWEEIARWRSTWKPEQVGTSPKPTLKKESRRRKDFRNNRRTLKKESQIKPQLMKNPKTGKVFTPSLKFIANDPVLRKKPKSANQMRTRQNMEKQSKSRNDVNRFLSAVVSKYGNGKGKAVQVNGYQKRIQSRKSQRNEQQKSVITAHDTKDNETANKVNSFLSQVVNKYGQGNALLVQNNKISSLGSKMQSQGSNRRPSRLNKKIMRHIRKFSLSSIEDMNKHSLSELRIPKMDLKTARSIQIPWRKLKKVLTRGLRGPNVSRKGLRKFVSSNFQHKRLEVEKLQKSVSLANLHGQLKDDNDIAAFLMPLKGSERAVQYKYNYCQYVYTVLGKSRRKTARSLCRKWRRIERKSKTQRRSQ